MSFDKYMVVAVGTDALPVATAGFTIPLHATSDVTFAERVREYNSSAEAAADAYVGTDAAAAVAQHFAQALHAPVIKLGRMAAVAAAQVIDWVIAGTPVAGDVAAITVNGVTGTYTAGATPTVDSVAAGLRAALVTALAAEDVTVTGATSHIIVTADLAGQGFTYSSAYTRATGSSGTITATVTTANAGPYTDMDAIYFEDPSWFGLTNGLTAVEATNELRIKELARWAEANDKLFLAQTLDPDALTSTPDNILDYLEDRSFGNTCGVWHHDNDELLAVGAMAYKFQADPDVKSTGWAYTPVTGVSLKSPKLTSSEESALDAYNASYLSTLGGTNVFGLGHVASSRPIDLVITLAWYAARLAEAYQQLFADVSARNDKIGYSDVELQALANAAQEINSIGERVKHFVPGSGTAVVTKVADIPAGTKALRQVPVTASAIALGSAERVSVTAYVALP